MTDNETEMTTDNTETDVNAKRAGQEYSLPGRRRIRRCMCRWIFLTQALLVILLLMAGWCVKGRAAVNTQMPPLQPQVDIPVCTVAAGGGRVDFGSRSRGQLREVPGGLTPGTRSLTVSAGCTLARSMKLLISAPARGADFSWGGTDSLLRITARQGVLDGTPVQLQRLNMAGSPEGQAADEVRLAPGETLVAAYKGLPVQGRQFGVTLDITPVTGERDSRPVQRAYPETSLRVTLVP